MSSQEFQTLIFDNFLQDPDEVVMVANSQTYIQSNGRFPGRRSAELEVICNQVHTILLDEILKKNDGLNGLSLIAYFQKIPNSNS
jgi:hypothetical protein